MSKSKKVVVAVVTKGKKVVPVVPVKTKAPVKKTVMVDPRTKRLGRPPLFTKSERRTVASYLRKHGLTHGLVLVLKECNIKMSLPTAIKVAKANNITFTRGRPVLAK